MKPKHKVPEWVSRGKTIKQLIEELKTFEDQNREVRISLDNGDTHSPISILGKKGKKYCLLMCAEAYHLNEWQSFMDKTNAAEKFSHQKKKAKTPNQRSQRNGSIMSISTSISAIRRG